MSLLSEIGARRVRGQAAGLGSYRADVRWQCCRIRMFMSNVAHAAGVKGADVMLVGRSAEREALRGLLAEGSRTSSPAGTP